MKHFKVDNSTELKVDDLILINNNWAEIYAITEDYGIRTSRGSICRTKIGEFTGTFEI